VLRLFLPQTSLEEWALEDKADLRDGRLVIQADGGPWPVEGAVHFVKLVAGTDVQKLVSRVKTDSQLAQLGCERLEDSVVLGDSAYQVVPGYVAQIAAPPAAKNTDPRQGSSEADLLAAFILDKMS
jgi:hypothetical protein